MHSCLLSWSDQWQSQMGSMLLDGMTILSHEDTRLMVVCAFLQ